MSDADIEAMIAFLSTEDGGRQTPVYSPDGRYRPLCDFGTGEMYGIIFTTVGKDPIPPGSNATAFGQFVVFDLLANRLRSGDTFNLYEGSRLVAKGQITKVINEVLQRR